MAYLGNSPAAGENNSFKILDSIASYTLTFNGSSASVVSLADDTITKNEHRFITGQRVTYTHGGGTQITGLTSGSVYYIVKNDQNSIKLAPTYSDAIASTNLINFTGLGSGSSHTLNVAFDGVNTKFKATYDNGTKAGITRAAQLQISINGVIQQPHDSTAPPSGFGYDLDSTIIFSTAPVSTDVFWGNLVANNFPTFDISDNDIDNFTGNASTTSFTLSKTPVNSQNILVTLDGVVQYPSDNDTTRAYTLAENVLTFVSAPGNGVLIQVRHIGFAGATTSEVTGFYGRTGNVALRHIDDVKVGDVESIGISTFTVSGVGTVTVGSGSTTLLVDGDARVTGILTVGNTSLTLDGVNNKITIGSDSTFIENGVIGIGTTNAENHALNVSGTANISGNVTIGGSANVKSLDHAGISSSISDTATDIFVYDTSKDSDGGAWRKRTQHTSWYNETLNTSTRGSRREFPAVAVIVSDVTTDKVTIYDGDDPDLPMWMVISAANPRGILGWATSNITSIKVTAMNGIMVAGTNDSGTIFKFVEDFVEIMYSSANYNITSSRTIAGRNDTRSYDTVSGTASRVFVIVNYIINDVAMTVLPNAPIDDATGLPVPTIAVATDSGVSVIKDDGTVVDIRRTSDDDVHHVDLDGDRVIMFMELGAIYVATISSADQSGNPNSAWTVYGSYGGNTSGTDHPTIQAYGPGLDLVSMKDHTFATAGYNLSDNRYKGLSILSENLESSGNGMVAWAHTDFNTGYMHGDIKGAFLSDTDTTNAVGTELVTNGTFDSDTSGWSVLNTGTFTASGGQATLSDSDGTGTSPVAYQAISAFVVGRTYVLSYDTVGAREAYAYISQTAGQNNQNMYILGYTGSRTGTQTVTFVANSTNMIVNFSDGSGSDFDITVDNVSVRLAEEDRSINNKGLQVYGTVTKSAVATNAELVSYGPFSMSNYLKQPYNSDLAFAADDEWCFIIWADGAADSELTPNSYPFSKGYYNGSTWIEYIDFRIRNNGDVNFEVKGTLGSSNFSSSRSITDNNWHQYVFLKRGSSNYEGYIDGQLVGTNVANVGAFNNTNSVLMVGTHHANAAANSWDGRIALLRVSASAPSAEQIKKIYEDEKVLFQENAKATLYGSSDAVTALAYDDDTDLLHVGTSSGRSDFQGLRRINNTTTAVTTAITAQNEFIIEQ